MRIVETNVVGKHPDPIRCEDVVVLPAAAADRLDTSVVVASAGLVAVIDGTTDKTGRPVATPHGPRSGGRFAAEVLAAAIATIEPGTSPLDATAMLTHALDDAVRSVLGDVPPTARPSAMLVVFDPHARVVWRVGDCPFRIDTVLFNAPKPIDLVASSFRAAYLDALGVTPSALGDPGRDAILPLLSIQTNLANRLGEFGYGVLDGRPVPEEYVLVAPVPSHARELVLASDGYPTLPGSLAEAEAELATALAVDPHCTGPLRGTKGVQPGCVSFDDRSWVRLAL